MRTIQIPGYGPVKFPESMSDSEIALAIERDILPTITPQKEGVGAALVGGAKRFGSTLQTALESILDPTAAAKRGIERGEEIGREYAPGASLEAVKRAYAERGLLPAAGEAISQIPSALAEQAPNIAATLAGARAGARFGLPGAIAGATLPAAAQLYGSALERQAEAGVPDISRGRAAAAAVPGAALEVAATFIPLGRSLVGKLLGPEVEKALARGTNESIERLAKESLGSVLAKGTAVGALAEVSTEVAQQILERWQAGLPLTTPDALAEYGEAAYGAGLVGGPFGAVGRVGQRSVARGQVEKKQAELATAERVKAEEEEAARKQTPEYRQELNGKIISLQDELREVEPIAKDKTLDEDVRNEAINRAKEIKTELKDLTAEMKASMKEVGAAPTLAGELAKRKAAPAERQIVDEFGNIVKPKKAAMTEEEYAAGYETYAAQEGQRQQEIKDALARLRAEEEKEFERTKKRTEAGIQRYLAQLEKVEETNTQVLKERLAKQQQRKEEDVAQEITLDRINLVLENFGLRAAGVSPEVRKLVESKIDEGVVDRTVTRELGIQGLEGRTYRDEQATEVLPNIAAAIDKLETQRQKALTSKQELMDNKGQLTPAGYKLVGNEAKLRELKRLQAVIEGRVAPETAGEAAAAGLLEAGAQKPEAVAVEIEPGKPSGVYKQKAKEGSQTATGAFTDIVALMDDYRVGRFFGEEASPAQRKLASSKREDLITQSDALRKDVVDGLIQEVAYERQAQGLRPLTRDEAIGLGIRVDEALQEIITRSTALPRGAAIKEVVIEPAQMRGSEIVKEARTARVDPRPLSERQFGNPRRAVEVLAEYIKQTKDEAVVTGKRPVRAGEKPLLKKQYAAAPTDLIKDLDRVLRMENLQPEVAKTLEAARRRMEEGGASEGLEELVEEQVGRILRGTDRPFTLERDVTKPGGRRAMAAAGTAELIDEIKTQMRFDSQTRQFAEGEQRTVVPRGAGFAEVDVQPSLFPETEATARATPGMFQRLQKSGAVRKEKARIAETKQKAEQAAREVRKAAAEVEYELSPKNIQAKKRDLLGKIQAFMQETAKKIDQAKFKNAAELYDKVNDPTHRALLSRIEFFANQLNAEEGTFEISTEGFRLAWVPDSTLRKWAMLDEDIKKAFDDIKKLEKEAANFDKGSLEQRKAQALAKQQRAMAVKVAQERAKASNQLADRSRAFKQRIMQGLGLPGIKAISVVETTTRKKTKEEYEAEMQEYKKLPAKKQAVTPKPTKYEIGTARRVKVVPIKSKAEIDEEVAERQRAQTEDLKRRARATSPEALYEETKAKLKEAVAVRNTKANALKKFEKTGGKKKDFTQYKKLSDEVDRATANVQSLRENLRLLEATQYIPETERKRQPSRGPVGGAVPFYDKKFTPDQLRKMSGMGLSAFEGGRSYSVDDNIDFRIGETAGGDFDLEQANKRMAEVENKTKEAGIKFKYFPTMKNVTVDILKDMERQGVDIYATSIRGGVKPDGTVFVIGENHTDMLDLEKTLAHELIGHYSFEGMLGEKGMMNLMLKAEKAFATKDNESGLENLAKDLGVLREYEEAVASAGKFYTNQLAEGQISEKEVRRIAKTKGLREIIAYTMEKRVDQNFLAKAKRWIQELVGAIRAALKKYGLLDVADLSTSDLFYMMKQANKAFEEGKPMAYRKSDGDIDFRMATPKAAAGYAGFGGPDIIAKQQPSISQIKGNGFGLKFRTFVADQRAVLEEVMNRAKEYQTADGKRLLNAHLAADTEYFMRMLDNKNGVVEGSVVLGTPIIKDLKGRAGQIEKTISHEGMSLLDVFKTIKGSGIGNEAFTTEAISKYLIAYRALKGGLGADVVDIKNRVTEADLKKWLADGEKIPQFVEFRKKYNEYNKGLINFAVQSGALSEKKAQELLKNENYVPYYRVDRNSGFVELLIGNATPIRIGDFKNQPYLEELVGGDGLIMDVFASSLRNTQLIVDMGMTNLAARNAFFTLSEIGVIEKGKTGTGMHSGGGPAGKDIMRFYLNGDERWARVNTQLKEDLYGDIPTNLLMRSMEGLTIMTPTIVKFMSGPNNLLRKLITLNPRYAVNQVFRESLSAWGTTGANMAPILSAFGNLKDVVQGKGETFEKLRRASVLTGNITTLSSSDAVAKRLQNIGYGKNGLENLLIKTEELARAGEAATKISLYNAFVKQGLSEREAYLAVLESANMSRRGLSRSIYYTNQLVLFANAGIQGLDILYRAFTGKMPYAQQLQVKRKLAIRGLSVGLMTLAYAALMQDDEAYKNAPPEQRYANWFVRIPGF